MFDKTPVIEKVELLNERSHFAAPLCCSDHKKSTIRFKEISCRATLQYNLQPLNRIGFLFPIFPSSLPDDGIEAFVIKYD